jgi:hypothetical protein
MRIGGNMQCLEFLGMHGVDFGDTSMKERYYCPAAQLYQQVLQARRKGEPEPTDLPEMPQQPTVRKREMTGFGSPPEQKKSPVIIENTVNFFRKIKRISEDYTKELSNRQSDLVKELSKSDLVKELSNKSLGSLVKEVSNRSLRGRETSMKDVDEIQ